MYLNIGKNINLISYDSIIDYITNGILKSSKINSLIICRNDRVIYLSEFLYKKYEEHLNKDDEFKKLVKSKDNNILFFYGFEIIKVIGFEKYNMVISYHNNIRFYDYAFICLFEEDCFLFDIDIQYERDKK